MKKILLVIFFVLSFCTRSLAESSVWKVQRGGSTLYLGGTCHLLRQSDFPLPVEFDRAYKVSDVLVFETDIGNLKDPLTQQKLISKAMYADGATIEDHLSAQTYSMLKEYCTAAGIPLAALKQYKPSIIALTMMTIELAKMGVTLDGVDMHFYERATRDRKDVEGLETVDEQINFIVKIGEGIEDAFIKHAINDITKIKKKYEKLVDAWKKGNVATLNDLMITEIKTKFPPLYKNLLTDRNQNWLPIIDAYQQTPRREFILVGVGHLVGPDGIVESLRKKGYLVEKLQ